MSLLFKPQFTQENSTKVLVELVEWSFPLCTAFQMIMWLAYSCSSSSSLSSSSSHVMILEAWYETNIRSVDLFACIRPNSSYRLVNASSLIQASTWNSRSCWRISSVETSSRRTSCVDRLVGPIWWLRLSHASVQPIRTRTIRSTSVFRSRSSSSIRNCGYVSS